MTNEKSHSLTNQILEIVNKAKTPAKIYEILNKNLLFYFYLEKVITVLELNEDRNKKWESLLDDIILIKKLIYDKKYKDEFINEKSNWVKQKLNSCKFLKTDKRIITLTKVDIRDYKNLETFKNYSNPNQLVKDISELKKYRWNLGKTLLLVFWEIEYKLKKKLRDDYSKEQNSLAESNVKKAGNPFFKDWLSYYENNHKINNRWENFLLTTNHKSSKKIAKHTQRFLGEQDLDWLHKINNKRNFFLDSYGETGKTLNSYTKKEILLIADKYESLINYKQKSKQLKTHKKEKDFIFRTPIKHSKKNKSKQVLARRDNLNDKISEILSNKTKEEFLPDNAEYMKILSKLRLQIIRSYIQIENELREKMKFLEENKYFENDQSFNLKKFDGVIRVFRNKIDKSFFDVFFLTSMGKIDETWDSKRNKEAYVKVLDYLKVLDKNSFNLRHTRKITDSEIKKTFEAIFFLSTSSVAKKEKANLLKLYKNHMTSSSSQVNNIEVDKLKEVIREILGLKTKKVQPKKNTKNKTKPKKTSKKKKHFPGGVIFTQG